MEYAGLYKSDNTIHHQVWPLSGHEVHCYLDLGKTIGIANYAVDAFVNVTSENVQSQSDNNDFSYFCTYNFKNSYHIDAWYWNDITDKSETLSFDILFSDKNLIISNIKTTEANNQKSVAVGRYTKIS